MNLRNLVPNQKYHDIILWGETTMAGGIHTYTHCDTVCTSYVSKLTYIGVPTYVELLIWIYMTEKVPITRTHFLGEA